MTVIDSYLDTLFAPYPDSPRLREARTELRRMMEDQQDGLMAEGLTESQAVGRVIADFGSLEEIAPVLGIGTELGRSAAAPQVPAAPVLELDRAQRYIEAMRRTRWLPAVGVSLFVLCPTPMLLLIALTADATGEPAGWAIAVGLTAVLVLVAAGLLLLLVHGARVKDFEDIEKGTFTPGHRVRETAHELKRARSRAVTIASAVAIMLWVLCALPVILSALIFEESSSAPLVGVVLTLAVVALGLLIMLGAGWSDTAVKHLLQEPEEDSPERSDSTAIRVIAALYWPVVAAIYLAWSFTTNDWGLTWLVWPVAGVLYAGLSSLSAALRRDDADPRTGAGMRRA